MYGDSSSYQNVYRASFCKKIGNIRRHGRPIYMSEFQKIFPHNNECARAIASNWL